MSLFIIPRLMSLFGHFGRLFFSLLVLFPCLVIFEWMPGIMNFTWFGAGYFSISKASFWGFGYIKIIWSFCVSFLWFLLRESAAVVCLLLIIPHCSDEMTLSTDGPQFMMWFFDFMMVWHQCTFTWNSILNSYLFLG